MLIYAGTLTAMCVLCVLMGVYAHRQRQRAGRDRRDAYALRANLLRSATHAQQWRDEAIRLREIVDRVEH